MTAYITNAKDGMEHTNARDMELIHSYSLIDCPSKTKVIDCRLYMSRYGNGASPVYCLLWINGKTKWASGQGKATGFGYDKNSSAVGSAIYSSGIKLSERIYGVGPDAILGAIEAIGVALGCTDTMIVEAFA